MTAELPTPDWVLIGVRHDGMCVIYASRTLSYAELEPIVEEEVTSLFLSDPLRSYRPYIKAVELRGRMKNYAFAGGSTYEEAFQNLMRHWSADDPDNDNRSGELGGRPALEGS